MILYAECYRPPDNDAASISTFFDNFQYSLDKINQLPKRYNIVIVGDFNAHYDVLNLSGSTTLGLQLHSFLEGNNLTQLITEPTRVTSNNASILDLVITNCPNFFRETGTLSPPSNCDHSVVFAKAKYDISCF